MDDAIINARVSATLKEAIRRVALSRSEEKDVSSAQVIKQALMRDSDIAAEYNKLKTNGYKKRHYFRD